MRVVVRTAVVAVGLPRGGPLGGGVNMIALVPRERMQTAAAEEGDPSLQDEHGDGKQTLHGDRGLQTRFNCKSNIPAEFHETQAKESSRISEPFRSLPWSEPASGRARLLISRILNDLRGTTRSICGSSCERDDAPSRGERAMADAEREERDRNPADGDAPESAPTDEERRKWAEDADSSEAVEPPDTEESIREDDGDFPMGSRSAAPILNRPGLVQFRRFFPAGDGFEAGFPVTPPGEGQSGLPHPDVGRSPCRKNCSRSWIGS